MIVNDKHQFIFVHVPKAAGTSISAALKDLKGNNRRVLAPSTKHETINDFLERQQERHWLKQLLGAPRDRYFRFGFVRHPWERLASLYSYMKKKKPVAQIELIGSFREFILEIRKPESWIQNLHSMRQQIEYFSCPQGQLRMDYVGHYETLNSDLTNIRSALNLNFEIPHKNKSNNSPPAYRDLFDEEMINIVRKKFRDDISTFSYKFDATLPQSPCSGPLGMYLD